MKICVTATGGEKNSQVDPRFGRCAYYVFYDTETKAFEPTVNENASGMSGVGIRNAQLMTERGVQVLISGHIGPNAARVLQESGINVISGITGTVEEAIRQYESGQIQAGQQEGPTVAAHYGAQSAPQPPEEKQAAAGSKEQQMKVLTQQADILRRQIEEIQKRISDLEKS